VQVHAASLVVCYIASIWNGAGFYVEVFSSAYLKQFEQSIKTDREARALSAAEDTSAHEKL